MYTVRDYQGRVNGIFNSPVLVVDGMNGPKTRDGIANAMAEKGVKRKQDLFTGGVRGIVWHWTASTHTVTADDLDHYNWVHDVKGNTYDGAHTVASQVNYDWRKGRGASHTKSMNTGWLGQSVSAMHGAQGWPKLKWGNHPLTWEGIDAMLEQSADLIEEYDIPLSKWTLLSHAEVEQTLGVKQRNKWDFMVLPGDTKPRNAVEVGDELRKRLKERFL